MLSEAMLSIAAVLAALALLLSQPSLLSPVVIHLHLLVIHLQCQHIVGATLPACCSHAITLNHNIPAAHHMSASMAQHSSLHSWPNQLLAPAAV